LNRIFKIKSIKKIVLKIGRIVLDEAARSLRVGMTTDEIDRIVHEVFRTNQFQYI